MNWKIYYGDGTTFEGDAENAPTRDVQAIVQPCPRTRWEVVYSTDYYVWRGDEWCGVDIFGLWDYLASDGWKRVLFGRMLPQDEWQALYRRVKTDVKEIKGGFKPGERKPAEV